MTRWRVPIIGALVLFVGIWVVLGIRHHHRTNEWAHGGDPVKIQGSITATDAAGFGPALAAAGGSADGAIIDAQQGFVVTVHWSGTPSSGGYYQFILLDTGVSPARAVRASTGWEDGKAVGPNWAGAYEVLPHHYAWATGLAENVLADGLVTDEARALGVPARRTGSATLGFWTDKNAASSTDPVHEFVLAMVFVDSDGEVRWARRIPLTAAG